MAMFMAKRGKSGVRSGAEVEQPQRPQVAWAFEPPSRQASTARAGSGRMPDLAHAQLNAAAYSKEGGRQRSAPKATAHSLPPGSRSNRRRWTPPRLPSMWASGDASTHSDQKAEPDPLDWMLDAPDLAVLESEGWSGSTDDTLYNYAGKPAKGKEGRLPARRSFLSLSAWIRAKKVAPAPLDAVVPASG
mmetsp:Transcript_90182/g.291844  ORF Transcript_90182/g.291844 Transcript_90182/m.291844 type:complete len:189 (-) Transcript_90182:42-608(-)